MTTTEGPKKIHHGRNIKRFREMFGLKQEALAIELGPDWSQKKVSRLEDQEVIDDAILAEVAKVLKVPPEAIMYISVNVTRCFGEADQGDKSLQKRAAFA